MLAKHTQILNNITNFRNIVNDKGGDSSEDNIIESRECCICFTCIKEDYALSPCGHTQFCKECINFDKCPICKVKIDRVIRLYL